MSDHDLSAEEQRLAVELAGLSDDPSQDRRARIMAAVRARRPVRADGVARWRLVLAGVGAVGILLVGSTGVVAASQDALPDSPTYQARLFGEHARLAVASPDQKVKLRIGFANARTTQAREVLGRHDAGNARGLLRDSRQYLAEARQDLGNVGSDEQGEVENELNQAEADEQQAEAQLNQEGEQR